MQFFIKLLILLGVVLFNSFNTNVLYFSNKITILNIKFVGCKAVNNLSANLTVKKKSEELSHKSPNDTLKGDNNLFVEKYVDQNKEDVADNEYKLDGSLDIDIDLDLEDNKNNYDSLCFSDLQEVGEPLQLVYPNKDHTELVLDYEVLKVLEGIPKPVYPVALIGSVNSGKSFLLNLLNDNYCCNVSSLDNPVKGSNKSRNKTRVYSHDAVNRRFKSTDTEDVEPKPFRVANSPEPETYGIWVYSKPLKLSRLKLQKLFKENSENTNLNLNFYSLKNVSTNKDNNNTSKLSRMSNDYEFNQLMKSDNLDDVVNVVFLDVEGFNSHKNVYKYDEALFSVVSSICSEVVYLSNKTLNTSDLQLIEELIKSSLLSKISNLYTAYSDMGESRDEREEIFQYFLKMFENKNLTFLVNEYNYSSEKGFENLVNLLKAPKRDLSLHEVYMYHNKQNVLSKNDEQQQDFVKKLKYSSKSDGQYTDRSTSQYKEDVKVNQYSGYKGSENNLHNRNEEYKDNTTGDYKENKEEKEKQDNRTRTKVVVNDNMNDKYVCSNRTMNMEDVMFNSFGYIFHMLFNSVNMAVLPSTSKNPFMSNNYFGMNNRADKLDKEYKQDGDRSTKERDSGRENSLGEDRDRSSYNRLSVEEEYIDQLSNFKFGLFTRSTQNPLEKYCVIDGVTTSCYMTGRDLAEMVRLTVNTLSLNKFYKLVSNLGPVEGINKIDYKDAFDEYFRVFRSTRLLMIKNDLYETYRIILKKFIDGDLVVKKDKEYRDNNRDNVDREYKEVDKEGGVLSLLSKSSRESKSTSTWSSETLDKSDRLDQLRKTETLDKSDKSSKLETLNSLDQSNKSETLDKSYRHDKLPSVEMLREYGNKLKEQLLYLMVKNFENETFSEDFNNIKKDLVQGLDRVFYLAEADLSTKIRNYCMGVGDTLFKDYVKRTSKLTLPVLPSRLKFLHNLPEQFGNRFKTFVDYGYFEYEDDRNESDWLGLDGDPDSSDGYFNRSDNGGYVESNYKRLSEGRIDLLSQDLNCVSVYEEYLTKLKEKMSGIVNKNKELIETHFNSVFNRAMKHYKTRFVDIAQNYEIPLEEALEKSKIYIKEAENVIVTHLGDFHAIEAMATSYKTHLRNELTNEEEKFKKNYNKNCLNTLESIISHYIDRYNELLKSYAKMPANPEMLYKYYEYMSYLSQTEVLRVVCADPATLVESNNKLTSKLKKKYTESLVNNANAVGKALTPEFQKMDQFLLEQVPNCRFYHYFRHNAKRYAKYKITRQLIFSQLNLETVTRDPVDVLGLEELLYNPENMEPVKTPKNLHPSSKYSFHNYNIDLKDIKNRLFTMKDDKLNKKFINLVIDYYVKNHINKFKKMFVNKYYRTIVLVCSVTLLGFSGLSMCLAQNWFIKLAFSMLGFVSYGFLVGLDRVKSNSTSVLNLFKRVLTKGLYKVWHLIGLVFEKLWDLVVRLITMAFMEAGHMQTFKFGLFTAFTIYVLLKLLIRRLRSKREGGNRRWLFR